MQLLFSGGSLKNSCGLLPHHSRPLPDPRKIPWQVLTTSRMIKTNVKLNIYPARPDQSSWRPASRHRQHLNRERPWKERSGHRESRSRRPSKRSSSRESSRRSRSCRMSRMRSRSSSSTHSRRKPTSRSTSPSPPWERAGLVR